MSLGLTSSGSDQMSRLLDADTDSAGLVTAFHGTLWTPEPATLRLPGPALVAVALRQRQTVRGEMVRIGSSRRPSH